MRRAVRVTVNALSLIVARLIHLHLAVTAYLEDTLSVAAITGDSPSVITLLCAVKLSVTTLDHATRAAPII